MREMRVTNIEGKIYLFPVPVIKDRKYLIFCSSEDEAQKVEQLIRTGKVTHPDLVSPDFILLSYHTDKRTKILVINPESF